MDRELGGTSSSTDALIRGILVPKINLASATDPAVVISHDKHIAR